MYNIVLFLHLLGVAVLVGAVTTSLLSTLRVQTADTVAKLRSLTAVTEKIEIAIGPAMAVIIASGLYLVAQHGDHANIPWTAGWVITSMAATLVVTVIGVTVEASDTKRLHSAIADAAGERPHAELRAIQVAARPTYIVFFGTSQVVALLFLMTNRPGASVAIAVCVVAAVASVVAAAVRNRAVRRGANTESMPQGGSLPQGGVERSS